MPTITIETGVLNDDADMLVKCTDAVYPFLQPHGQYCKKLVMGVNFESGDDIVIKFPASETLKFWIATSDVGAIKQGTEADIGGGVMGRKLTFSTVTTDLHVYAVLDI